MKDIKEQQIRMVKKRIIKTIHVKKTLEQFNNIYV